MSNLQAFLDTIAVSEGVADLGDRGFNVLVGSRPSQVFTFSSYRDHPRLEIRLRKDKPDTPENEQLVSTAAGRYQILAKYFDAYRVTLSLPDFSPPCQDAIAVQMISECGAFDDVRAGRFESAIARCASRWASFPGAGYAQHENAVADLRRAFINAGGVAA
jgi:muramidase (phage lysozyme)